VFTLLFLPFKLAIGLLKLSGVKGLVWLALGVGIGLLVAPQRGAQLRAQLQSRLDEVRAGRRDLADGDPSL